MIGVVLALLACGREPPTAQAWAVPSGVEVRADRPFERVEVRLASGEPIAARTLPAPTAEAWVPAPWIAGGRYVARVRVGEADLEVPFEAPEVGRVRVALAAPVGVEPVEVADGDVLSVTLLGGARAEAALWLEAVEPGRVELALPDGPRAIDLPVAGARAAIPFPLRDGGVVIGVRAGPDVVVARVDVGRLPDEAARERLRVVSITLPADGRGRPDRARAADRVDLPATWWTATLRGLGLGWRPRDDQAPWTHQGVEIANDSDRDVSLAVSSRIEDEAGPVAAFRSRVRGVDLTGGAVTTLIAVPAGRRAVAVLPLYVDERLARKGVYTRVVEVTPLGADAPLHRLTEPLVVRRGSAWASGGFLAALAASLTGLVILVRRGPRWMAALDTPELVTIALFGSLTFVVAAAARLVGYGVAAVLGPFAPLLTGLVDDAFRTCLLAALVALVPRPGVVTLASLVGYLMRGVALGSFHPADLLYFGSIVCFLEGSLWVAGLTRGAAWVDEPPVRRWARLSMGFGVANALAVASGLVVTVVLYRLFYADWYVALTIGLHGFLYVVLGCAFAGPFADRVRRVAT